MQVGGRAHPLQQPSPSQPSQPHCHNLGLRLVCASDSNDHKWCHYHHILDRQNTKFNSKDHLSPPPARPAVIIVIIVVIVNNIIVFIFNIINITSSLLNVIGIEFKGHLSPPPARPVILVVEVNRRDCREVFLWALPVQLRFTF